MKEKKTVKMGVQDNGQQKLSYEQLNEACAQLYQQNQALMRELKQANMTNMFKRLDYLFKIVEQKDTFSLDEEFFGKCVKEIKEALTIKQQEESEREG